MPRGDGTGPSGGGGIGAGRGRGGGGGGGGRGKGRGSRGIFPISRGTPASTPPSAPVSKASEGKSPVLEDLRRQAGEIAAQLEEIRMRIAELDGGAGARLVAVVDKARCKACGICIEACPAGAIAVFDAAEIQADRCTGCAQCVSMCPHGAISLHRSAQGA